jgi:hypothetical protein
MFELPAFFRQIGISDDPDRKLATALPRGIRE